MPEGRVTDLSFNKGGFHVGSEKVPNDRPHYASLRFSRDRGERKELRKSSCKTDSPKLALIPKVWGPARIPVGP